MSETLDYHQPTGRRRRWIVRAVLAVLAIAAIWATPKAYRNFQAWQWERDRAAYQALLDETELYDEDEVYEWDLSSSERETELRDLLQRIGEVLPDIIDHPSPDVQAIRPAMASSCYWIYFLWEEDVRWAEKESRLLPGTHHPDHYVVLPADVMDAYLDRLEAGDTSVLGEIDDFAPMIQPADRHGPRFVELAATSPQPTDTYHWRGLRTDVMDQLGRFWHADTPRAKQVLVDLLKQTGWGNRRTVFDILEYLSLHCEDVETSGPGDPLYDAVLAKLDEGDYGEAARGALMFFGPAELQAKRRQAVLDDLASEDLERAKAALGVCRRLTYVFGRDDITRFPYSNDVMIEHFKAVVRTMVSQEVVGDRATWIRDDIYSLYFDLGIEKQSTPELWQTLDELQTRSPG